MSARPTPTQPPAAAEPPADLARRVDEAWRRAVDALLAARHADGRWRGELSSSALSTATAVIALHLVDSRRHAPQIRLGADWLERHANPDGGWGDTVRSFSNISTSLLGHAALRLVRPDSPAVARSAVCIEGACGSLDPDAIVRTVVARYGKDRTFSVPILMACAISGVLGEPRAAWRRVLPLPFELAAFPRGWFAALRLPVVSYALPALIAIGYARFHHAPPAFLPWRILRRRVWPRVSRLMITIQPESGGFLEATPLTSFVTMALASAGEPGHPVVTRAIGFLEDSMRSDGSWPIDTDLSTWVTTLSVKAIVPDEGRLRDGGTPLDDDSRSRLLEFLLRTQYRERHPFTDAKPGGWAWTDLSGGVPDADDTPGALLALRRLCDETSFHRARTAALAAIRWLLDLQNRDGGIPTFCRGWGALPFDRSSPDLTAHTVRAWHEWLPDLPAALAAEVRWASRRALDFLAATQHPDGSWSPLWFGNQHQPDESNRVYGTAHVLKALAPLPASAHIELVERRARAARWLAGAANDDGGWGGGDRRSSPSSVEETALAVDALAALADDDRPADLAERIAHGVRRLLDATADGTRFDPSPIGFYFAKLWYFEALYPHVWTIGALAAWRADNVRQPRNPPRA